MELQQHCSDRQGRGLFVSIDGPSGAGKSTIVQHLAQLLVAEGHDILVTAEPSDGPIGVLARELTETVHGHALACLYAADRYHHIRVEIEPSLRAGQTVISDRYIPSGLVMQRFDGVSSGFLWLLNAEALRPDLMVVLEADADVIAGRLWDRGPHNRFQARPGSSQAEIEFYHQATAELIGAGFPVLRVNCNDRAPEQSAALIRSHLSPALAATER